MVLEGWGVFPDNDIYLQSLASASYATAMYPEARDAIARCIALNPWHAGDFSLQANILARLGEREAALESADKALELDPNLGEWHSEILQRLVPIPR